MLALIKEQQVVSTISEGGWFELAEGTFVSPALAGWSNDDGYSLTTVEPAAEVPQGKRAINTRVAMVDGAPRFVFDVEDAPVPLSVSARQFKLMLLEAGLLDQVEEFIASQGRAVQIAYENSGAFVRTESMMQAGFAALGFTPPQIDDFFRSAAEI